MPGTTGILSHVARLGGADLPAKLAGLFCPDEPDSASVRERYLQAVRLRLEETWYEPLSRWCDAHSIALMGHPDRGDEIGVQRLFQVPGQDLVWRYVEQGKPSAIEGHESTQGKCTSSAMIHHGRRRNSNEFAGAYGAQTTFEEVQWLADWCLVRGVNLLIPHAFYHSVRGARKHERPPQLGPHTPQWDDGTFARFAAHCSRLCWINTDSRHVCNVAILTHADRCPWHAAKVCFENQIDFNYIEPRMLETARITDRALELAGMRYDVLIVDEQFPTDEPTCRRLQPMLASGRVVHYVASADERTLVEAVRRWVPPDLVCEGLCNGLRYRHVEKLGRHFYLLFNERADPIDTTVQISVAQVGCGVRQVNPGDGSTSVLQRPWRLRLKPYEMTLFELVLPSD
jgi:hypothetical protein